MRLSSAMLRSLRALADSEGACDRLDIVCTVEGGPACRLSDGDWSDARLASLAPSLIAELGYKTIEHAAGGVAVIRIALSGSSHQIDLGEGFELLEAADD